MFIRALFYRFIMLALCASELLLVEIFCWKSNVQPSSRQFFPNLLLNISASAVRRRQARTRTVISANIQQTNDPQASTRRFVLIFIYSSSISHEKPPFCTSDECWERSTTHTPHPSCLWNCTADPQIHIVWCRLFRFFQCFQRLHDAQNGQCLISINEIIGPERQRMINFSNTTNTDSLKRPQRNFCGDSGWRYPCKWGSYQFFFWEKSII